ncbi:MAG: PQQ-binding-like beta-propeller repeat protein, partial [Planctomycetota bacterium]
LCQELGDAADTLHSRSHACRVNGWPWVVAYDLEDGEEIWRIEGGGDNPTPTPFAVEDTIVVTNAHGGKSPIIVVSDTARGNLTENLEAAAKSLVWRTDRGGSYMSTPVVIENRLYLGNTNGVLRCIDFITGEPVYENRLASRASIYSSLVCSGDKLYCSSENGTVYVVQAGDPFKLLAENPMGDPCFATPAISDGTLFIRTTSRLVAISRAP